MSAEFHSLTFVMASPDRHVFQKLADICASLSQLHILDVTCLSPNRAMDMKVQCDPQDMKAILLSRLELEKLKVDFCLQPAKGRRKKLLICDMDSTLIGQECIDELADFAGVKDRVSAITERAMRGELDFEAALKERVGLLKGLDLSILQECFDKRIHLNRGADTLAGTMAASGAKTVIVSGGFTFFTSRIAALAGFAHHQANVLLDDGQTLSGKVQMPILGRQAKRDALYEYSKGLGGPQSALAIGDGANDLAMIQAAGLGIAYRAKPVVANAAHCAINHTDLTTALYFQGYKEDKFIY